MKYPKGVPVVLVLLTVNGCGWLDTGGNHRELKKGDITVIPPNTPMEYATDTSNADSEWEFYWLNLTGDNVNLTAQKLWEDGYTVHACRDIDTFQQIFQSLLNSPLPDQTQEYEHAYLLEDLFHKLLSELLFTKNQLSSSSHTAEKILTYIQKNYPSNITLEELSQEFFLSKNQIIRIFRKRTGYTPYEYIKYYRLAKACELLSGTSHLVGRVGEYVGYRNQSHFISQFHEQYGMTPNEYRSKFSPSSQG